MAGRHRCVSTETASTPVTLHPQSGTLWILLRNWDWRHQPATGWSEVGLRRRGRGRCQISHFRPYGALSDMIVIVVGTADSHAPETGFELQIELRTALRPAARVPARRASPPPSDRKGASIRPAPDARRVSPGNDGDDGAQEAAPLRRPALKPLEGRSGRAPDGPAPMTGNEPPALPEGEHPGGAALPATLEPLIDTARAYAREATSKNTNRATPPTGATICAGAPAGASISSRSPTRNASASISRRSLPAPRAWAAGPGPSPRSSVGSRRWSGISSRGPCPSTARTHVATALAGVRRTHGRPLRSRRRRCCPSMSWPCSTPCPSRAYETCATAPSSSSASPAACDVRKSPASS